MDMERFKLFERNVECKPINLRLLNINKISFKDLMQHPYFDYELTKLICQKRDKQTINKENLFEIIQERSTYEKILPYIEF
ncbi:MAG: hypothetical protein AB7O73_03200, partial [Bacteroidia bacterium]